MGTRGNKIKKVPWGKLRKHRQNFIISFISSVFSSFSLERQNLFNGDGRNEFF